MAISLDGSVLPAEGHGVVRDNDQLGHLTVSSCGLELCTVGEELSKKSLAVILQGAL